MEILYTKFNKERAEQFQIYTQVYIMDGSKYVKKTALNNRASAHLKKMIDVKNPYHAPVISASDNEIVFKYINGKSIGSQLSAALYSKDDQMVYEIISDFNDFIKNQGANEVSSFYPSDEFIKVFGQPEQLMQDLQCFKPTNIDLTFDNVIEDDNGHKWIIDYEWVFDFDIPIDYVKYRCAKNFHSKYKPSLDLDELYELLEVDIKYIDNFNKMEDFFYKHYVYNSNVFISGKFNMPVKQYHNVMDDSDVIQIFFPVEGGYNEQSSMSRKIYKSDNYVNMTVAFYEKINGNLRIDPSLTPCAIFIKKIDIYIHNMDEKKLVFSISKNENRDRIVALNQLKAIHHEEILYISTGQDPNFILDYNISTQENEYISVSIDISLKDNIYHEVIKVIEEQEFNNKELSNIIEQQNIKNVQLLNELALVASWFNDNIDNANQELLNNLFLKEITQYFNDQVARIDLMNKIIAEKDVSLRALDEVINEKNVSLKFIKDDLNGFINNIAVENDVIEKILKDDIHNRLIGIQRTLEEELFNKFSENNKMQIELLEKTYEIEVSLKEKADLENIVTGEKAKLEELTNIYNEIINSKSWKATKIFRRFSGYFKKQNKSSSD